MLDRQVADYLVEHGWITPAQVEEARRTQGFFGGRLETQLIKLGYVSETVLGEALTEISGIPFASWERLRAAAPSALQAMPLALIERYRVCPFHLDDGRLRIATLSPRDAVAIREMEVSTGLVIEPWITIEPRLYQALERHFRVRFEETKGITPHHDPAQGPRVRPTSAGEEQPAARCRTFDRGRRPDAPGGPRSIYREFRRGARPGARLRAQSGRDGRGALRVLRGTCEPVRALCGGQRRSSRRSRVRARVLGRSGPQGQRADRIRNALRHRAPEPAVLFRRRSGAPCESGPVHGSWRQASRQRDAAPDRPEGTDRRVALSRRGRRTAATSRHPADAPGRRQGGDRLRDAAPRYCWKTSARSPRRTSRDVWRILAVDVAPSTVRTTA